MSDRDPGGYRDSTTTATTTPHPSRSPRREDYDERSSRKRRREEKRERRRVKEQRRQEKKRRREEKEDGVLTRHGVDGERDAWMLGPVPDDAGLREPRSRLAVQVTATNSSSSSLRPPEPAPAAEPRPRVSARELNPYLRQQAGLAPGQIRAIGPTLPPPGALERVRSDGEEEQQGEKRGREEEEAEGMERRKGKGKRKTWKMLDDRHHRTTIEDYVRNQHALETCPYCLSPTNGRPQAPLLALGTYTYLALNPHASVTTVHIVPLEHVLTMLDLSADAWTEVRNFMKCLLHMYHATTSETVLFAETVRPFGMVRHAYVECIPMPESSARGLLKGTFRQVLLEESERVGGRNRPVVETGRGSAGLRGALSPKVPYFHVWLGLDEGLGHVIESDTFPIWLAREVIAKQLDLPPSLWRRPKRLDRPTLSRAVERFRKRFEPYNWTLLLSDGHDHPQPTERTAEG